MSCFTFGKMRASLDLSLGQQRRQPQPVTSQTSELRSCFLGRQPLLAETSHTEAFFAAAPQNGAKVFMMRHGRKVPRLSRPADQRKALLRSLTTEILRHGAIQTTESKAKAVRKYVDKMIQLAKRGDLHARRQVLAFVYDKDVVSRLFDQAGDRYGDRNGGYCRIKREAYSKKLERVAPIRPRRGDHAKIVAIELV